MRTKVKPVENLSCQELSGNIARDDDEPKVLKKPRNPKPPKPLTLNPKPETLKP